MLSSLHTGSGAPEPSRETPPARVLVVDDEESNRTFAERALTEVGYAVAAAASGPDALDIDDAQGAFDLYVVDMLMPQMRGDELAGHLRERHPDAKVLYFTGHPDLFENASKKLAADEGVVAKPAHLRALLEAVSLLVYGHDRGPRR